MRQREVLAYTAGIVDGEGCIAITSSNALKRKVKRRLVLDVNVTNTSIWLIQWLKMQYGGTIKPHVKASPNHQDCYRWRLTSRQAMEFLKLILPYLQIKRPQAEIAINFQSHKKYWGSNHKDTETIALEEAQKILLQSYKHGPTLAEIKEEITY